MNGATSCTEVNTSNDTDASTSLKEQTTAASERHPPSSEAAQSKAAADDVMVQIRARKSEVGPSQQICQLFWHWQFQSPLYSLSSKWIIINNCSHRRAHDVLWWWRSDKQSSVQNKGFFSAVVGENRPHCWRALREGQVLDGLWSGCSLLWDCMWMKDKRPHSAVHLFW